MAQESHKTCVMSETIKPHSVYYRVYRATHPNKDIEWREKNREKINKAGRLRYKEDPEKHKIRTRDYRQRNHDLILMKRRDKTFHERLRLMEILGGAKCVKCSYLDPRALQLDHINGGGCKDMKNHTNTEQLVRYYIKNPELAKKTLQVLCANCNWIKVHVNRENELAKRVAARKVELGPKLSERA